jgi:hypothetical protein
MCLDHCGDSDVLTVTYYAHMLMILSFYFLESCCTYYERLRYLVSSNGTPYK